MTFQTKSFGGIVAGMLNQVRATAARLTDFTEDSSLRAFLDASAIELEELYQNIVDGIAEAIPVSVYLAFGFSLEPAVAAVGSVTFSQAAQPADTLVPAGTRVGTADGTRAYATLTDLVIPAGSASGAVSVRAVTVGTAGDADPGEVLRIITAGAAALSVDNPAPIGGGSDGESEDSRRRRFTDYIRAISRGTQAAIEYGARQAAVYDGNGNIIERVVSARAVERFQTDQNAPLGYVDVYISNGGNGASDALLAACLAILKGSRGPDGLATYGWKAAGCPVRVHAANTVQVPMSARILTTTGTLTDTQRRALTLSLAGVVAEVGQGGTLYQSASVAAGKDVAGVLDFKLYTPAGDITFPLDQTPILGALAFADPDGNLYP